MNAETVLIIGRSGKVPLTEEAISEGRGLRQVCALFTAARMLEAGVVNLKNFLVWMAEDFAAVAKREDFETIVTAGFSKTEPALVEWLGADGDLREAGMRLAAFIFSTKDKVASIADGLADLVDAPADVQRELGPFLQGVLEEISRFTGGTIKQVQMQ